MKRLTLTILLAICTTLFSSCGDDDFQSNIHVFYCDIHAGTEYADMFVAMWMEAETAYFNANCNEEYNKKDATKEVRLWANTLADYAQDFEHIDMVLRQNGITDSDVIQGIAKCLQVTTDICVMVFACTTLEINGRMTDFDYCKEHAFFKCEISVK